jgi:large subunit ribosomal protein L4
MKVDVYNMKGNKLSKKADLPAEIFEVPINTDLMHQAYVRQMANARIGTHKTKGRSEVSGGGRKPWRQKGTGRARHGSIRAPQWVGGGKVHTPSPRDYSKKMPVKMRRGALRSALSVKASEQDIVVVDELKLGEPKTKLMAQALEKLVGSSSALVILPSKEDENYETIMRSTRNLPHAKTLLANYINIRDLLGFDKVVMPLAAIDVISGFLS